MLDKQKNNIDKDIEVLLKKYEERIANVEEIKEKIIFLYGIVKNGKFDDRDIAYNTANDVLEKLFYNPLLEDSLVPLSFLNTSIGKILGQVKYGIAEKIYTVSEVAVITGKSPSRIHQEIGVKLKGEKRKGATIIYETDLNEYLKRENIPLENKMRI